MSKPRLRYSGLISFSANVLSVLTGLIFTTTVTRRLSVEEFGAWQFYSSVLSYFALPAYIVNYWLTREVSRGRNVINSAVMFNFLSSWLATTLFLSASIFLTKTVFIHQEVLGAFAIWLMCSYLASSTDSASSGSMPYLIGYGIIIFELTKITVGAILVGWMRFGLFGAVASVNIALILKFLVIYRLLPVQLKQGINLGGALNWLKRFWIPMLGMLPGLMFSFDNVLVTMITGSTTPAAYIRASTTFSAVISFSSSLGIALYPRLLSGGGRREVEEAMKLVMMFAIPMTLGALTLAEPLLYILRKEYSPAVSVLRAYAVISFLGTLKAIFTTTLLGTEKVDLDERVTYNQLSSSVLVKVPIMDLLNSTIYIIMSSILILWLRSIEAPHELFSFSLGLSNAIISVPFLLYYWILSKKRVQYCLPMKNIMKYMVSGFVMEVFLSVFYPTGAISVQISKVMSAILPVIAGGAFSYFISLYLIDKDTRDLVKLMIVELIGRKQATIA